MDQSQVTRAHMGRMHITSARLLNRELERDGFMDGYAVSYQTGEYEGMICYGTSTERNLSSVSVPPGKISLNSTKTDKEVWISEWSYGTDEYDPILKVQQYRDVSLGDVDPETGSVFRKIIPTLAWFRHSTRKIVWWSEIEMTDVQVGRRKRIPYDNTIPDPMLLKGIFSSYRSCEPTPELEAKAIDAINAYFEVLERAKDIYSMWKEGKIEELMRLGEI